MSKRVHVILDAAAEAALEAVPSYRRSRFIRAAITHILPLAEAARRVSDLTEMTIDEFDDQPDPAWAMRTYHARVMVQLHAAGVDARIALHQAAATATDNSDIDYSDIPTPSPPMRPAVRALLEAGRAMAEQLEESVQACGHTPVGEEYCPEDCECCGPAQAAVLAWAKAAARVS